ncbi:hypothetical protein LIER_20047 [Lithospermum erythrorhizon]|uniref:Uncharacterized protein n=1 Tax=Lithospermum erythrorhizon TaxID=34254 RepID=A0AAV3QML7_LITER
MTTDGVKMPSTENLVESVDPSVRDTVVEGAEDKNIDISNATGTEPVTAGSNCDNVVPSVADTGAETADLPEERSMPTTGQGVVDTLNVDVEKLEILENDGTSIINTRETIVEDIFEGRVSVRPNVIDSVIVNERDMKSVEVNDVDVYTVSSAANSYDDDAEIPPPDTMLRFVYTTDTVAEETPRERETDSPNDTNVMPVIESTEKKVDTDARPSVADLGETTIEEHVTESMPSGTSTGDETIERPSAEVVPDVIGSVVDNIHVNEVDFPNIVDVTQNQKKSKRRKHQASNDNQIDVHETVTEKQMPTNVRPTVIDNWHPVDDNQGSDDEDVVVVTRKGERLLDI